MTNAKGNDAKLYEASGPVQVEEMTAQAKVISKGLLDLAQRVLNDARQHDYSVFGGLDPLNQEILRIDKRVKLLKLAVNELTLGGNYSVEVK